MEISDFFHGGFLNAVDAKGRVSLPASFRRSRRTAWSDANRGGEEIDSFLEGPCFDGAGRFHLTDIPNGRVFRIATPGGRRGLGSGRGV